MVQLEELPNELLEHILYNVDQETLRSNCVLVSNTWRKIIQSVPFWKRYHRYWDRSRKEMPCGALLNAKRLSYVPDEIFLGNHDWRLFSLINPKTNPFEINLLQNSDGRSVSVEELNVQNNRYFEDGFTKPWPVYPFWEIFSSRGKGWHVEKSPAINNDKWNDELIKKCPNSCFIASYHSCSKSQSIDLIGDCGISTEILHNPKYQFDIDVTEWHIMKGPCRYELKISLHDEDNVIIQDMECDSKFSDEFGKGIWGKIHRTLTVCGIRRLRFITFYHGATSNQPVPTVDDYGQIAADDWADVGTKITGGSISLSYPMLTKLTKDEQLYSNRYIVYPKFKSGKTWSTIDSFGPLGNNKFSLGSFPVTGY